MMTRPSLLLVLQLLQAFVFAGMGPLYSQATIFTDETDERLPTIEDVSHDADFVDIDRDGDLDVLVSNSWIYNLVPNLILLNDGTGHFFEDSTRMLPLTYLSFHRMTSGDIERDGDFDLYVAANQFRNKLYVNRGSGYLRDESFDRLPRTITPRPSTDAVFVDVDGDIGLDYLVSNFGNQRNDLSLNDGFGYFTATRSSQFPSGKDNSERIIVADVDGDHDVDVYIVNYGDENKMMINDGRGFFSDESGIQIPPDDYQTYGGAFGDVDRDGDFDLVLGNVYSPTIQLFVNRGDGFFEDRTDDLIPSDGNSSMQIAFGDVNNDGYLDILSASYEHDRLLINNGSGRFEDQTDWYLPGGESMTDILILGDMDGDGDLDIFECNHGQNHLFINNGTPDAHPPVIPRTFHHPDTKDTLNTYLITTTVWDNISVAPGEVEVTLMYRFVPESPGEMADEEYFGTTMQDCGGYLYRGRIPARRSGWRVEYFVKARDRRGNVAFDPAVAPDSVFSFLVDPRQGMGDVLK